MTLIKQEDAIEEIESAMESESTILIAGLACAKGIIASLPSAEADWIPCSKQEPPEKEYVLVCFTEYLTGEKHIEVGYRTDWNLWSVCGNRQRYNPKCVAWMPLPKSYREDGE